MLKDVSAGLRIESCEVVQLLVAYDCRLQITYGVVNRSRRGIGKITRQRGYKCKEKDEKVGESI